MGSDTAELYEVAAAADLLLSTVTLLVAAGRHIDINNFLSAHYLHILQLHTYILTLLTMADEYSGECSSLNSDLSLISSSCPLLPPPPINIAVDAVPAAA